MITDKDIEILAEYEELIVLLGKLHEDTSVLEKQHQSLHNAFISAQHKLDSTIASSSLEMDKIKKQALSEFSAECKIIVSEIVSKAEEQAISTVKKIQTERKALEAIRTECDNATAQLTTTVEKAKSLLNELNNQASKIKSSNSQDVGIVQQHRQDALSQSNNPPIKKYIEFKYGEVLSGAEIWKKYNGKTATPIIVQAPTWTGDYCYVITEYDKTKSQVKGRIYLDGKPRSTKGYPEGKRTFTAKTEFIPYKSPNENSIILNELNIMLDK